MSRDFGNLSMEFKENINDYYTRVTNVADQMKMYGDEINEKDIVNKILSTVTKAYNSTTGVIQSRKDLSTVIVLAVVCMIKAQEERVNIRSKTSLEGAF